MKLNAWPHRQLILGIPSWIAESHCVWVEFLFSENSESASLLSVSNSLPLWNLLDAVLMRGKQSFPPKPPFSQDRIMSEKGPLCSDI